MHDMAANVAGAEVGIFYDKADAPGEAQDLVLRTALLPIAQAATGEPVEAGDCLDLHSVVSESLPRDPDTGVAYVTPEEMPEAIAVSIKVGKGVPAWVEDSPLADLARDVAAGAEFFDAFTVLGLFGDVSKINEEERWRLTLPYAVGAQSIGELFATTIRQILGPSVPLPSVGELAADFRTAHAETSSVSTTPRLPTIPLA